MDGDLIDLRSPGGPLAHRIRLSKHSDDGLGQEPEDFSFQPHVPTLSKPPAAPLYSLIDDILLAADTNPRPGQDVPPELGTPPSIPNKKHAATQGYAELVMLDTPRRPAGREEPCHATDQDPDTHMAAQDDTVSLSHATNTVMHSKLDDEALSAPSMRPTKDSSSDVAIRLQKTEALRDALSREVGQHKATISKLEGSISSYEKQIKQKDEETMLLKANLAAAEREAAEAKIAAGVTPERCRVSARALTDEAQRAQHACQQKESELTRLQSLLQYESQEVQVLKEFINQERLTLQSQADSFKSQLESARAAASHSQTRATSLAAQLQQAQDELRDAKREVWSLNNSCIELKAEAAAIKAQATASQAAAAQAQQQVAVEVESRRAAQAEMREVRSAGIKLYKQIRAVAHALEGHMHVFQPIPKVSLSIRSLQEWCVKQAPYWGTLADQAALDADNQPQAVQPGHHTTTITAPTTAADAGPSQQDGHGSSGGHEVDVTLNLAALMQAAAPFTASKKR